MNEQEQEKKRTSLELYHLKQQIRELENKRSFNQSTSLVTLYIPPKTQLSDISAKLRSELSTATNIKDKTTGKAVADAIRSILARMQYLKNTENGLAIFAGITEDAQKVEYYAIEPISPITKKDYICDTQFHVEHLKEMIEHQDMLGIIVIDRGGATFATIQGSNLNIIAERRSNVPGKHNKGGQSAGRIERGIEIMAKEYYGRMAREANRIFLDEYPVKALVIGGPAMSKDIFLQHPTLDYRLKEKIYKVYDVGYTGIPGIRELLARAKDDLDEYAMIHERNLFQRFLTELATDSGKAIYGEKNVLRALKNAAVDVVLFSEKIDRIQYKIKCKKCGKEFIETVNAEDSVGIKRKISEYNCPNCNSVSLEIIQSEDLLDKYEKLALETGASIEIISASHEDGLTLLNTFTGIAAILRYSMEW